MTETCVVHPTSEANLRGRLPPGINLSLFWGEVGLILQINHLSYEKKKKTYYFPLYLLVNKDPYNG